MITDVALAKKYQARLFINDYWQLAIQSGAYGVHLGQEDLDTADLIELFNWSEETFLEKTEGSAIRRIGYERWLRNIAVSLGNAPSTPTVIKALEKKKDFPSELVQEHVSWALAQHI